MPEKINNSIKGKVLEKSALGSPKAHLRLWLTMAVGLTADLLSKQWAIRTIGDPEHVQLAQPGTYLKPIVIIEDYLTLSTVYNPGAVAGALAGKTAMLILASIFALVFLSWFFISTRSSQWSAHIAIGMLFSGALGNLYDRLFNQGRVIDFIEVNLHVWPADPWPTFNVADALLCAGVAILLLTMLRQKKSLIQQNSTGH